MKHGTRWKRRTDRERRDRRADPVDPRLLEIMRELTYRIAASAIAWRAVSHAAKQLGLAMPRTTRRSAATAATAIYRP